MAGSFVLREYRDAHEAVLDSVESSTQSLRSFTRGVESATEATDGLEESIEDIHRSAERVSTSSVTLSNRLGVVEKSIKGLFETSVKVVGTLLEYNDSARLSIRGTSLMSASIDGMRNSVNSLTVLGPKVASALMYSSKEAAQFSANLISDMERVSGSLDIREASKQVEEYALNVRGSATMMNMSSSDMIALQHQMVGQAHLSLGEMQNLMTEMAGYSSTLGLEGKDVQEMTAKHMETVMALDKDSRKAYISDLAYAAGVQKRAAIDFGKYATSLTQKQGSEALTEELKLSALSGVNASEVSWALSQASVDPKAAEKQQEIIEKSLQSFGVSMAEYEDLFAQRREGTMDNSEYERFRILEAQAKTITDMTGKSLPDLLGLKNVLQEVNIPTKEDAATDIKDLTGKDAQKDIQDRLITTDETVSRFNANIADIAIGAADATGALGTFADTLRDITAANRSGKESLGIDSGGIIDGALGGLSLLLAKKLGGSLLSGGAGAAGGGILSRIGAGASGMVSRIGAGASGLLSGAGTAIGGTLSSASALGATSVGAAGAAPIAATVGTGALLGYGIAQGIQKISEATTGKDVSTHAADWWTSDLQKKMDDENERGKMLHEVGAGSFRDKGVEANLEREKAIQIWTKELERASKSEESVAMKMAERNLANLTDQLRSPDSTRYQDEERAKMMKDLESKKQEPTPAMPKRQDDAEKGVLDQYEKYKPFVSDKEGYEQTKDKALMDIRAERERVEQDLNTEELKLPALKKEMPYQPSVGKPQPGKDPVEGFEKALSGIKLGGIERHLGNNRKVIENIVPLLSDMRDSLLRSSSSGLISAV
jgi:hypothetical protein